MRSARVKGRSPASVARKMTASNDGEWCWDTHTPKQWTEACLDKLRTYLSFVCAKKLLEPMRVTIR